MVGKMKFHMLIDGRLVGGDAEMDVLNPATEEVLARSPRASAAQLNVAVAAAERAFPAWSAMSESDRARRVTKLAESLETHLDDLARLLTQEQGKPLAAAVAEVQAAAAIFRYFAAQSLAPTALDGPPDRDLTLKRRPLGVVAAITPWNFPLGLMAFKAPAALMAGNTLVLKPPATAPLATLRFGEIAADIVPPGVLNVVSDANDLGEELVSHPAVAKVSFTGSTATGRKVMSAAAGGLKRLTLELGGNDPAIVLSDCDPRATARRIFEAAFQNSGQVCIAVKRAYVHDAIYDEVCDELARLADNAIVGNGLDADVDFGPLQNQAQFDRVIALIEDARTHGRIVAGGRTLNGKGYFVRPTIVRDIDDGTRVVDEEQFGPVLPVIRIHSGQDGIDRANRTEYGLGASIWSSDVAAAQVLAAGLEAGTVWINTHAEIDPRIPFAGAKSSGLGQELGSAGLHEFTQAQVISAAPAPSSADQ
jgi:acyl-CoA reductase-like NAD-dependent aldehyde dehydrogenase